MHHEGEEIHPPARPAEPVVPFVAGSLPPGCYASGLLHVGEYRSPGVSPGFAIEHFVAGQTPFTRVRCIFGHSYNTKSHSLNVLTKVVFINVLACSQIAIESNDGGFRVHSSCTCHHTSSVAIRGQP